ncbi:MAG: tyrosine-type recombinase/integrase, partial [Lentisphaerae bacterium]|nr:tyrosine-type recombinase/integrase [Lentisphaerota bacterium]
MGLQMRKTSKWWYGRWEAKGKTYCENLGIKVRGKRPRSLKEDGNVAFERSRTEAQLKLSDLREKSLRRTQAAELVQTLHEIRTGRRVTSLPLKELCEAWDRIPRKREPSERYISQVHSTLGRFVVFMRERYPSRRETGDVTREIALAFMTSEEERGVSPKTWNSTLILLRSTFRHLRREAGLAENPLDDVPTKEAETVFRKPFSPEELRLILGAVRDDAFARPIIVTGMCTAMRLGDCCLLRKEHVDMANRFITVKTSKTGETVEIPIFPLLHKELERHVDNDDPEFVFPEQALMYLANPSGVSWRMGKALAEAGFRDPEAPLPRARLSAETVETIRQRGGEILDRLPETPKTTRIRQSFQLYMEGHTIADIMDATSFGKGTVSGHLNQIEKLIGQPFIRPKIQSDTPVRGEQNVPRDKGVRRASTRDFHSFRVTWITLALTAGVPMEIVCRVTGHRTVDIVLKHY